MKTATFIATALLFLIGHGRSNAEVSSAPCDRECLKGFITQYIDAMLAHTPDVLPLAEDVRFTEDCKEINVGEGYWKDISGSVAWRLDVIDVRLGGAFAFFVIKEGNSSILYAVRLKIVDEKITQIETIVVKNRTEGMLFQPQNFKSPGDSLMTKMPNPELLNTREKMIDIASKYPEAMKQGKKSFNDNGLYFTKTAYRLENGQLMAGPGCTFMSGCENIGTQTLPKLSGMFYKPALIDEEVGIVVLRMNFGPGSSLDVFEAFKIYNDTMHVVMAIMQTLPDIADRTSKSLFGWDYDTEVTGVNNPRQAGIVNDYPIPTVTAKGVALPVPPSADGVILELFDITGRLVYAHSADNVSKQSALLLPLPLLPAGHYIGRVKYHSGSEAVTSRFFTLHGNK